MVRRGAWFWIAAAGWLACWRAAHAQPISEQDRAAAQALFEEAMRLTAAGRYGEACPKLAESQRLDGAIGTRFYLADCLERTGLIASAWTNFVHVADEAKTLRQPDRERVARRRAEALRPRLPWLTLTVPDEVRRLPGLVIQQGARRIGEPEWGVAIPVDPGDHLLSARAPGREPWQARITAREATAQEIAVPLLAKTPGPEAGPAPRPRARPAPGASPAPDRARMHPRRLAGYVTGGVGAAALGAGAAFGIRAALLQGQADCDDSGGCATQAAADRLNGAIVSADVSTTTFVIGSALFAGGAVLVLTAPQSARPGDEQGFTPTLQVGPGGIGVGGAW